MSIASNQIFAVQSESRDAYVQRSDGTWSKGKYVLAHIRGSYRIDNEGNKIFWSCFRSNNEDYEFPYSSRHLFSLNPTSQDSPQLSKEFGPEQIRVISDKEFQKLNNLLQGDLSVQDSRIRDCVKNIFGHSELQSIGRPFYQQ